MNKREVLKNDKIENLFKELGSNAITPERRQEIMKEINGSSDEK